MNRLMLLAVSFLIVVISVGVYFTVDQSESLQSTAKISPEKPSDTSLDPSLDSSLDSSLDALNVLTETNKPPRTKEIATKKTETKRVPNQEVVDVKLKKKRFFEFLMPMIIVANDRVIKERSEVLEFQKKQKSGAELSTKSFDRLLEISNKYKLTLNLESESPKIASTIDRLLLRVDTIPASLILAQSANESAWGTSRFAREANNYFGMWCFFKGCGLKPAQRASGLTHEVAKFDSVQQGVVRYVHNLNTNSAYKMLRTIRSKNRYTKTPVTGINLANGLVLYSERGEAYVNEIQSMIRFNKLENFNR